MVGPQTTVLIALTIASLVVPCVVQLGYANSNPLFRSQTFKLDPLVPLSHCTKFGPAADFKFEWQISLAPKWTLEMRFTADIQRGFSAIGFHNGTRQQLITGYPVENIHCARQLFDTYSPYDIYGNVYPNFPEIPGKLTHTSTSEVKHYLMRNLSVTSRRFLTESQYGGAQLNITLMWAYMQQSLFNSGCYMGNLDTLTEYANFNLTLTGSEYLSTGGVCKEYNGPSTAGGVGRVLDTVSGELLVGEQFQNTRVAALFLGGDLLAEAGSRKPSFSGVVRGGDSGNGVCASTTTHIPVRWSGFHSDIGGITKYEVTVGTAALPSLYLDRYDAGTNQAVNVPVSNLKKNVSYIIKVTALDFSGLSTTVVSKPIRVLNNGLPLFGNLYQTSPASGVLALFQKSATSLSARWDGWRNEDHAVKNYNTYAFTDNGFSYAVGQSGVGITSVQGWTAVPSFQAAITVTGLSLSNGAKYTVSIRSTNCAGTTTQLTTAGITVDTQPPGGGIVRAGNTSKTHAKYMTLNTKMQLWWWSFSDMLSGIAGYEWAISQFPVPPSTSGSTGMVKAWVAASPATATTALGSALSTLPGAAALVGQNIYWHVKAIDNVGNFFIKTSNATKVVGY